MNRTEIITCPPQKMPPIIGKIVCGDNCDVMGRMPNECVDLVITSPPYDNLRKYGGDSWDFFGVAWQLKRIIKPGGVIVWVVADATINGSETGTSMQQALHFKQLGLRLHDTMMFIKQNPIPLTHNRYEQAWEYMFVLSKGKPKTWNPITCCTLNAGASWSLKRANTPKENKAMRGREGVAITKETTLVHNTWTYVIAQRKTSHPATFPNKLAADHIKSWSNEGDLVLDPFSGSGTTIKIANDLKRQFIGIEINQEYCDMAKQYLGQKGLIT